MQRYGKVCTEVYLVGLSGPLWLQLPAFSPFSSYNTAGGDYKHLKLLNFSLLHHS